MHLSTLDQRFLELMDRIEQTQQEQIAELARRLEEAERQNRALEQRIAALEEVDTRVSASLTNLNATLARLLAPSERPPSSDTSSGGSGR